MFVDMGSAWEISWQDLSFRLFLATVLGGLIGIEREWTNHAAGFRTHILVCLGSTTIMLLSIYGFNQFVHEVNVRIDPARLAAQVVSGIGFLGAGAILRNGNIVKGLTTAASVWTVAAIGLCVGAGFYTGGLICTFMVLISLNLLNRWEKVFLRHNRYQTIEVKVKDRPGLWSEIITIIESHDIEISNIKMNVKSEAFTTDRDDKSSEEKYQEKNSYTLLQIKLKSIKREKFIAAIEKLKIMIEVREIVSENIYFEEERNVAMKRKRKRKLKSKVQSMDHTS